MPDVRIYVVDDDDDDRLFIIEAINAVFKKVEVIEVVDGEDFITTIQLDKDSSFPKLILLDVNMPKVNGLEVAAFMQTHPEYQNIPIVMFSTSHNPDMVQYAMELGVKRYISKPFNISDYLQIVKEINDTFLTTN